MLKSWFFVFLHMFRILPLLLLLLGSFILYAQNVRLPVDIRQHNLTTYNASLFNPAFSLDRNNPQSVAIWTRWQWQSIDADPTTIFLNYTRKLNNKSAVSAGFFQHNTGIFFNTGGVLNYAHTIGLSPLVKLSFGANLFGFQQELADARFQTNPQILLPQQQVTNDFILQFAPGINLSIENFSFSMASENLFDYNFTSKDSNTLASDKIFMGMVSYGIPILMGADSTAFLRPSFYMRTIPLLDNQIGMGVLFSTNKYWGQLGYNNFYGISVGAGGTFFNKMSLGALIEFGTSTSLNSKTPSFEIIASYFLGKPEDRRKVAGFDVEDETIKTIEEESNEEEIKPRTIDEEKRKKEAEKFEKKKAKELAAQEKALAKERRKDSIAVAKREKEVLAERKKMEEEQAKVVRKQAKKAQTLAAAEKLKEEKRQAIAKAREAEAIAVSARLEQQHKQDSINKVDAEIEAVKKKNQEIRTKEEEKADQPKAGEKYEEVTMEDGLKPGYYLIANVFGTKKYFDAFMKDLTNKGLNPKSFFRSKNKYNFAYLARYDTMSEARKARDGKFGGRYPDKTWIYRVIGE